MLEIVLPRSDGQRGSFLAAVLLAVLPISGPAAVAGEAADPIDFSRTIRPILSTACFTCHGPDAETREGGGAHGLRLDTLEGATEDIGGYAAVVPGKPGESELLKRVTSDDDDERMPPADAGKRLSPREAELLAEWIRQGAPFAQHWAYVKPTRPAVPEVADPSWANNAIDRFILARLTRAGLRPSPETNRYTLVRRVSLGLTGLPPSPEEAEAFAGDTSPDAYERLVDRLLASPAYGEHWARSWLDLARYADSAGYADDPPRTNWLYRDWVIRAINANEPFDQFTIEQLAGDLLPEPTQQQLIATGFHRNTPTNNEGGTDDEEFRNVAVVDRTNTTMSVWMGTTMGCAECHTHKYDPITQEEYFRFFAFFNNTEDSDKTDERPTLGVVTEAQTDPVPTPIMRELPEGKHRVTRLQHRGNYLDAGDEVTEGVPAAFPALPKELPPNRLALARWLVDPRNPLSARVAVNRYWQQLFGIGLVETSEDFGTQGEPPSHPELLDYLAVEFMESGWDVKALLRRLVTSAAYRQSSRATAEMLAADPDNRLLARGPRFRMPAEVVRDQALFAAGLLSAKMHGPPVNPPQPSLGLSAAFGGGIDWKTSPGEDRYRRGLYTTWRRSNPYPSMAAFDAPSREVCTVRRDRTNTPLQALVTLNDPVYIEAAQALARRMAERGTTPEEKVRYGFMRCLVRPPTDAETARLAALHEAARAGFSANGEAAKRMATDPVGPLPEAADPVELAAWTAVANVLLNLDETLMKP